MPASPDETPDQAKARYRAAAHAMQTGVAMTMTTRPAATEPKHLRVGINSAMVEASALVRILITKGILTEHEWYTALADAMEEEQTLYERDLSTHHGRTITLQ
jgi:hypothetical protein